ncbi:MAG: alpha/beta hydrolase [Myxococcales bacterium]|nr:alpha/beta hydrolase [Myxococcales bacterium]
MKPTDQFIAANGLRHHLDVWDGGGDTTVLLLHGYLDLGRAWTFLAEALPQNDWHVAALDWRGHGQSEWVGAGGYYHFVDYVRDLDAIARAVRRKRLIVVAHSMGAMIATLWLGARPAGADGLLLVEGLGPMPCTPAGYVDRLTQWLDQTAPFDAARHDRRLASLDDAVRRLMRAQPKLGAEKAARLAAWAAMPTDDGAWRWRFDPLHRTRAPVPYPTDAAEVAWKRVRCPTRWLGGAQSQWLGPHLDRWLDLRLDVPRRLLPGAGHMVQNDAPDALAGELIDFVSQ